MPNKTLIITACLLLILIGCGGAAGPPAAVNSSSTPGALVGTTVMPVTPTATRPATPSPVRPSATPTATQLPSPTPLPLSEHEWDAGPVLLRYDNSVCVDWCGGEWFSHLPSFILYSDGRLIRRSSRGLEQSWLREDRICSILNTFEAYGLFNYDPDEFYKADQEFPRLASVERLELNAWDSAVIHLGRLSDYLPGGSLIGELALPLPMLMTYHFAEEFKQIEGTEPYIPDQIAILIDQLAPDEDGFLKWFADEGGQWPLTDVRLADLYARAAPYSLQAKSTQVTRTPYDQPRVVSTTAAGAEAAALLALFDNDPWPGALTFEEDGRRYVVAIRALLPYESAEGVGGPMDISAIPGPDVSSSTVRLHCSPEDGAVDFYERMAANAEGDFSLTRRLSGAETAPPTTPRPTPYERGHEDEP